MAHAVVLRVKLVGDVDTGMKMLDEHVVPAAKALPGFVRGTWMHQPAAMIGTAVVVFDTEANASAGAPALQPPPGGPTVVSCEVFEVAREA